MKLYRFLGSVYFAITLIVTTLLFVIVGTFLEAWSDSHLFAAHFIYSNPVFLLILWCYFINIFISTLLRYPFKIKHIPFIITHIGLLMLFGGALLNGYFGAQGTIFLLEGTGSNKILLANSYALHVETPVGIMAIPLRPKKLGPTPSPSDELSISVVEWKENVEEKFEGWIHNNEAHLFGFPPLPVHTWSGGPLPISLKTSDYTLTALKTDSLESVAKKLSASSIAIVQNKKDEIFILAKSHENKLFEQKLDDNLLVVFDRGYSGYGYAAQLPPNFPDIDLLSPLMRSIQQKPMPRKKEDAIAQISLLISTPTQSEIIQLTYDKQAEGLKWPAFNNYLLRFAPMIKSMPSHIRLREARQINYPDSTQPFSYESDLWIDGEEKTISMNRVHQTKKGYRFYMASLSHRPYAKAAQIVVNRNPGRYILTYPGAIILTLGMLLLYLKKLYV